MKILLIDDDPFALKLLERQLRQRGHHDVVACQRAATAIEALNAHGEHIGLMFCDLQMPEVDGVEFIRHLARLEYRGDLVLVSGKDERILETVKTLAQAHRIRVLGAYRKPMASSHLDHVLAKAPVARPPGLRALRSALPAEDLRHAIRSGSLCNHYQPKVDLRTGKVVGVEALVRWRHPIHGLVFPDQFITVAEDEGLIDALTHVVIASALVDHRAWKMAGWMLGIAVNVSMENLRDLDFPDRLEVNVEGSDLALADLTLEVTESRLMQDPIASLDILSRLRLKGFKLAIDDFGTGHSSLAQLRDAPFHELKLDHGFVHGASEDRSRRVIVEATLAMASRLGMKVVAEGVEDQEDWDCLTELGCDVAQGYFIARPMPGEEVPNWCASWQASAGARHTSVGP